MVLPYTREHLDIADPTLVRVLRIAQLLVGALSFVVSVNVAILVCARTVTRAGEIAVRTALGASRARILAQLFIEALALSSVGAAAGLLLAGIALSRLQALVPANGALPFWLAFELSPATVLFIVAQRTREIGIRAALGAAPHRLLLSIFGRVARQLALGVLFGSLSSGAIFLIAGFNPGRAAALLLTVAGIMLTVGFIAALGPARRGLRVQASEALRAEACAASSAA